VDAVKQMGGGKAPTKPTVTTSGGDTPLSAAQIQQYNLLKLTQGVSTANQWLRSLNKG
jgi:hypothetical protein